MALEFEKQKPQPLMLGDKAHYTLSSYDPVSIEVLVPHTTEKDVDFALDTMLQRMNATRLNLSDPAWVAQNFEGMENEAQLRQAIRSELDELNVRLAEQQKVGAAVNKLTERLQQSIPAMLLARYRQGVQMNFEQQIAQDGMTVDQFLARSGASMRELETMFDAQARQVAEQEAALDAYAREKKLSVQEDEFSRLLGIPPAQLEQAVAQAKAAGQYDNMRDAALHAKAAQSVVAECSCVYHHETEEEAQVRIAQAERLRAQFERDAEGDGSGFELV